ncbi:hypothetical protein HDV57DRAFT_490310 [Trichoderma longibrachiatum]
MHANPSPMPTTRTSHQCLTEISDDVALVIHIKGVSQSTTSSQAETSPCIQEKEANDKFPQGRTVC